MEAAVQEALHELSQEVRDLSLASEVDRIEGAPDPLEFYRKYVSRNVPCIFTSKCTCQACITSFKALTCSGAGQTGAITAKATVASPQTDFETTNEGQTSLFQKEKFFHCLPETPIFSCPVLFQ